MFRELFLCPKTGFSLIFSLIGSTGGNCTDKTLHAVGTLFVPGQYAATWGKCALLQWSGGGHQAAELSCGRLRRCPVIRPVADLRIYDTPYGRRRTLTAAYRAGACLSLDDFPAVSASYDPSCVCSIVQF